MRCNIVATLNGVGLSRDARLLAAVLEAAGHTVAVNSPYEMPLHGTRYDWSIHLELLTAAWLNVAPMNAFVPNQEWFYPEWLPLLDGVDLVLAKTRHAFKIFDAYMPGRVQYTSWTSEDRLLRGVPRRPDLCLHTIGASIQKGTEATVAAFQREQDRLTLMVTEDPSRPIRPIDQPRTVYRYSRLSDGSLKRLQNFCGIHVCPSECEGFGLYIAEAMSVGAAVVTTDAAPMNELVGTDRGWLVKPTMATARKMDEAHMVNPDDLWAVLCTVLDGGDAERERRQRRAREWWEHNDAFCRSRLAEVAKAL